MGKTRLIMVAACAAAVMGVGASAAFAGEITGNGKSLKVDGGGKWGTGLHSRSFCAFSGQNDHNQGQDFTNAQNWGQDLKLVREGLLSEPEGPPPSIGCNPTAGGGE